MMHSSAISKRGEGSLDGAKIYLVKSIFRQLTGITVSKGCDGSLDKKAIIDYTDFSL